MVFFGVWFPKGQIRISQRPPNVNYTLHSFTTHEALTRTSSSCLQPLAPSPTRTRSSLSPPTTTSPRKSAFSPIHLYQLTRIHSVTRTTVRPSSHTRFLERRMIGAWKKVTSITKKHPRASYIPANFVLVTPNKRKSIRYAL